MTEHSDEKYTLQEEQRDIVSEPAFAYRTAVDHVHMTFDLPHSCDEKSFKLLMMVYAKRLIAQSVQTQRLGHSLSDEQLEMELESLPSFDETSADVTSKLSKEDYSHFMRVRKQIKGIAKWL